MFFDQWLGSGDSSGSAGGVDPQVASLAAGLGIDLGSLLSPSPTDSASGTQSQADISAALIQSAQAATSSYGSPLPWWAQGVADQLVSEGQFGNVYKAGEGLVYLGTGGINTTTTDTPTNKFASEMGGPYETTTSPAHKDYALTVTAAQNLPYTWDEKEVADAMKRLKEAGIPVDSFDLGSNSLVSVWGALVNRAAQTFALTDGQRKLTPWDVLDLYKKESSTTPGSTGYTGTKSTVARNVTDITEGEAWSQLQNNLSQLLGRDPSDQELRDFTYRMNRLAAENPAISKTITRYKNGEAVSSRTHTDPGFTTADMAQSAYDTAQNQPDYAEYRGASYLFNAVMSALGPIGG